MEPMAQSVTPRHGSSRSLGARNRHLEVSADLPGEKLVDFAVAGKGRRLVCVRIHVDGVIGAFTKQAAAVSLEVTNKIDALHAVSRRGSRITPSPAESWRASVRLASSTRATASSRLARASSRVAPWVLAPGSSSTKAT